jgi:LysR family transcriptional regulator (chromosome initiation inhibitor)
MNALDPAGLECLAALAEAGSFDGAAQLLHITQSAVSQRLRSLESNVGHVLVVRERPLRLTEPGKVLLRYARQMQALRADAARELGATLNRDERLPIAVNPNSLATWVLPALDPLVQRGLGRVRRRADRRRPGLHPRLAAPGRGAGLRQHRLAGPARLRLPGPGRHALRGRRQPGLRGPPPAPGLNRRNFASCPSSPSTARTTCRPSGVAQAFGVRDPQLKERFVPSSEAVARAAAMGWGLSVLPELLARPCWPVGRCSRCCRRSTWT